MQLSHCSCTVKASGGVVHPERSGMTVIARLLLGLLADLVVDSVTPGRSSFPEEMNGYLERRGLTRDSATHKVAAR